MIPNALSSTGAHADFWSHLQSMDYALERCLDPGVNSIEPLDRDRLTALSNFLSENFTLIPSDDAVAFDSDSFFRGSASRAKFVPDFDIRQRVQDIPVLKSWLRGSKIGLEKKIEKLIMVLNEFTEKIPKEMFKSEIPSDEFIILRKILRTLLNNTFPLLHK